MFVVVLTLLSFKLPVEEKKPGNGAPLVGILKNGSIKRNGDLPLAPIDGRIVEEDEEEAEEKNETEIQIEMTEKTKPNENINENGNMKANENDNTKQEAKVESKDIAGPETSKESPTKDVENKEPNKTLESGTVIS